MTEEQAATAREIRPTDGRGEKGSTIDVAGLDGGLVKLSAERLDELDSRVERPLLRAGDAGWDDAVLVWNGMVAKTPALVLQPTSAAHVAAAIGFACDRGLLLSVKGGGHNMAGTSIAERGLTLDMSRMRDVSVDPDARLAHVGPGCLLQDVDRATQAHGLATPLGSFDSEVGVAGLTLGGGLGYLTRRFGWTVDNLEEVEIVTADGQIRTAGRAENSDLFWGLRGGGGNFGVVTRFTFRLHAVGPTITGGLIVWSADRVDDVLGGYRELTESAPRELTAVVAVRMAPSAPFLPEEWHGKPIVGLAVCHSGADAEGDLAAVRALGDPIADLITEKPYTDQQSMMDGMEPKGHRYYWKTEYLAGLTNEFLDSFRDSALKVTSPAVGLDRHPPRGRAERTSRRRRGRRQPRRPVHDRVRRSVDRRRPRRRTRGLGTRCMAERPSPLDRRQLPQLPDRRGGRTACPGDIRRQLRSPRRSQGDVRPRELVPPEPEHRASRPGRHVRANALADRVATE
jgi:FAD binding domain